MHDIFLPDADFGQLSLGDKKMMALWDRIMADEEIDKDERYRIQQTSCNWEIIYLYFETHNYFNLKI